MSYAEVASRGHQQSPEEAAAPQPPQIDVSTASSTGSLIDVDTPSVHTVPSDFESQEIKTETQAARVEREEEQQQEQEAARARAQGEADRKKKRKAAEEEAAKKRRAEGGWLVKQLGALSAGGAGTTVSVANVVAVVGLSGWLGFKAWGLYDRGRLGWKEAGVGLGVLSAVGVVEGVFLNYFSKGSKAASKGKEH